MKKPNYNLTNGPGKLSMALGINKKLNTSSLISDRIWIQDNGIKLAKKLELENISDASGPLLDAKLLNKIYLK